MVADGEQGRILETSSVIQPLMRVRSQFKFAAAAWMDTLRDDQDCVTRFVWAYGNWH